MGSLGCERLNCVNRVDIQELRQEIRTTYPSLLIYRPPYMAIPIRWPMKGIHDGNTVGSLGCNFLPAAKRSATTIVTSPKTTVVVPGGKPSIPRTAISQLPCRWLTRPGFLVE